jgi:hypothetical protein
VGRIVVLDSVQVEKALRGELDENVTLAIEDPQEVQFSIIQRILDSPDADSVLQGQRPIGGRDCLERPFTLRGVRWHRSKYEEGGIPVFAVLDAAFLDDGETGAVTTGAASVMAQAYQLEKLGVLPCDVKIVESDVDTAAGFKPQWLVRADAA